MTDELDPTTVTEAVAGLRALGYVAEFELVGGRFEIDSGELTCAVDAAVVDRLYRFEGPSDPGDEMIVFALVDPASGTRGTLAAAFGPFADPELHRHLIGLRSRFD